MEDEHVFATLHWAMVGPKNKLSQLDFHDRVLAYEQAVMAGGPFVQNGVRWGPYKWPKING